jgi:hypothetical protein
LGQLGHRDRGLAQLNAERDPEMYVLFVRGEPRMLTEEALISFVRRLWIERELGLPPGTLTDDEKVAP